MKKVKFYSSLVLIGLSASLLVTCSSKKGQVTTSSSEQIVQTSTSSSETTVKKSAKSTTKSSSQDKQNKKTTNSSQSTEKQSNLPNSSEQVGQALPIETQAEISEQPNIGYQESIETNPIVSQETQQVVEQVSNEGTTDYPISEEYHMTQEEIEARVKTMIDEIPQIAEAHLNPETNGLGGWYTPEFVAELERQGYYEKLNAAIAELEAARTNNQ